MVKDLTTLTKLCGDELQQREYREKYRQDLESQWKMLKSWMSDRELSEFDEEVGNAYLEEHYGTHLLPPKSSESVRLGFRAIRMLVSYQQYGEFEFRSPQVEYHFDGPVGKCALDFLQYQKIEKNLAEKTIDNYRLYLSAFSNYMDSARMIFEDLSISVFEDFYTVMNYSPASRHNCSAIIRSFLRYVQDTGRTAKDYSVYIPSDNYKRGSKLPTTYEEQEIRDMISTVERASAIGKRDYLILLLVSEYGWRAQDVTGFKFSQIDWDNNVIRFDQHKTDVPVEFPLLSSVGNAIIDYLKDGRPNSKAQEIIVSHTPTNLGEPISSPTIHSIVTKYLRRAGTKDWNNKKHGPHSLRHSLATNLLKKNVPISVIGSVMGHQSTETTRIYISVDYDRLKACALPMPPLSSPLYRKEMSNGEV